MKQLQTPDGVETAHRIVKQGSTITGYDEAGGIQFQYQGINTEADFYLLDGAEYDAPQGTDAVTASILGGGDMANENVGRQFNRAVQFFAQTLGEEEALEIADLYPAWEPDKEYRFMYIVKHGTKPDGTTRIFQVMQAHTSQLGWEPGNVPALFKELGFTEDGTPQWVQPQGGHDAYKIGDIVSHNGSLWISTANGNVWEPGVYGWNPHTP